MSLLIWLAIVVVFLAIEAITVGLYTIWFAAGALVALIAGALGIGIVGQFLLFFAVSLILLFFTRPFALKYVNPHRTRTNYEDAVDKIVRVTERVDNRKETGIAILNGQEWTARTLDEEKTLEVGSTAKVAEIKGVKLILEPVENTIKE